MCFRGFSSSSGRVILSIPTGQSTGSPESPCRRKSARGLRNSGTQQITPIAVLTPSCRDRISRFKQCCTCCRSEHPSIRHPRTAYRGRKTPDGHLCTSSTLRLPPDHHHCTPCTGDKTPFHDPCTRCIPRATRCHISRTRRRSAETRLHAPCNSCRGNSPRFTTPPSGLHHRHADRLRRRLDSADWFAMRSSPLATAMGTWETCASLGGSSLQKSTVILTSKRIVGGPGPTRRDNPKAIIPKESGKWVGWDSKPQPTP
jgi:hypothetical protein